MSDEIIIDNPVIIDDKLSEPEKNATPEIKKDAVLFVCSGNTCRSPMCAALFNHKYAGLTRHAISAGLSTGGEKISSSAVYALKKYGVKSTVDNDYENHVSRTVTAEMIDSAVTVIGVSSAHALSLIMRYPQYATKITSFDTDIFDPYGMDDEVYAYCLKKIDDALGKMFSSKEENENDGKDM